ncbi:MAG TPA: hypothetical protein H9732_09655 [Candidatus Mediterraneibacter avicola]|nr:hypothetical protein [Candidatus Mediterraneibacter avicola]
MLLNTHFEGTLTFPWWNTANFMLLIPVTAYITRKMYRLTNSLWVGAAFNSMLIMWTLASQSGGSIYYLAQNIFTTIFAS